MTIKPVKELIGQHVSFYVEQPPTGWAELSGHITDIDLSLGAYQVKDEVTERTWMVLPRYIQDIVNLMAHVANQNNQMSPNWYENRDPATISSQMPKTAKIGVIPCSMAVLDSEPDLAQELAKVLNRNGIDAQLNTPDFILARFLIDSLSAFRIAQDRNVEWHGSENHMRMR